MGICWYCHWGWAKQVMDIYDAALEMPGSSWSAMHFGPAHIVWEDENFDRAEWCLENFDKYSEDLTEKEKAAVRWSLEELNKIPMHIRCPEPDDYDDEHPDQYPPPVTITMIRR